MRPEDERAADLVADARVALAHFNQSGSMRPALQSLDSASAIVIFPHVVSAALLVGGAGADGVLFVHDRATGHWVGPVFYTLAEGSLGLQAGYSTAEVVMIFNSPGALRSLNKGHLRFGIDASVAIGHRGAGASSAITADVDTYALEKGLVAGVALQGSGLRARPALDAAWYGKPVSPDDILAQRDVSRPDSARLAAEIEAYSH